MLSERREDTEIAELYAQFKAKKEMPFSKLIDGRMNKADEFSIYWYLSQAPKNERDACIKYIQEQFQREGIILTGQGHFLLGLSYLYQHLNRSIKKNLDKWLYHLKVATERRCLEAKSALAISYYLECQEDVITAIELLEEAALEQNPSALYMLGLMYHPAMSSYSFIKEIEKDYLKAQRYFNAAAEQNHPEALMVLARQFFPTDINKASEFAKRAIQAGNDEGFFTLGVISRDNNDYLKAMQFFKHLAEEGFKYPSKANQKKIENALLGIKTTISMEKDNDQKVLLCRELLNTPSRALRRRVENIIWCNYFCNPLFLPMIYQVATELTNRNKRSLATKALANTSLDPLIFLFTHSPFSIGDLRFRRQLIHKIDSLFKGLRLEGFDVAIATYILKYVYSEKLIEAILTGGLFARESKEEDSAHFIARDIRETLDSKPSFFNSDHNQRRKKAYLTTLNRADKQQISYVEAVANCRNIQKGKDNEPSKKRRLSR